MIASRWGWWLIVVAALGAMPPAAEAHLVNTGFGPFYDGMSLVFVAPANLITVLAVAMFVGLRGLPSARHGLFLLSGAWLVGATVSAIVAPGDLHLPLVAGVVMFAMGLLVALDLRVPAPLVAASAAGIGGLHGVLSGAALANASASGRAVVGVVLAVFTIAAITAAVVVSMGTGWRRIAVRVAGSWITAIGFLTVGWALKPG